MQNVATLLGKPMQDIALGWGMFSLAAAPFRRRLSFLSTKGSTLVLARAGSFVTTPPAPPPARSNGWFPCIFLLGPREKTQALTIS